MTRPKATLHIIAAACDNMGIGYKGTLPWRLKNEMKFFSEKTVTTDTSGKKNAVIMGRNTWFSIPERNRPLSKRINVVLSTTVGDLPGTDFVASSFDTAIEWLHSSDIAPLVDKIFVIGGEAVYKIAMDSDHKQRIYLTRIKNEFECDAFFPGIDETKYKLAEKQDVPEGVHEENGIIFHHEVYEKH